MLYDKEDHSIIISAVIPYVNDLIIVENKDLIEWIKDQIKMRLWMHDLRHAFLYISMNIRCNLESHMIIIHEHSYSQSNLATFSIDESRSVTIPMAVMVQKRKHEEEVCDRSKYQLIIGSHL